MSRILEKRYAISRRRLIQSFGALAAMPLLGREALAQPIFATYPFQLGVAAGDPLPDGFVIWTRLAPEPLEIGAGMPSQAMEVQWEVASDSRFQTIVQRGTAVARPELAHSVHVEVAGLNPATTYWYRFLAGKERSLHGRARTMPVPGASLERVRFASVGCQHYEQGLYTGYRKLAADAQSEGGLDFVFHYGDYIYEYRGERLWNSPGGPVENVRRHVDQEIYSLDEYRRRYAQYKMDPDLQAAHAASAWFVTWDDHEIENNWVGSLDENETPPLIFNLRRQAAAQAYYENMPLRAGAFPVGPSMQLYRRATYGDLLDLNLLDTRQYRTDQPCGDRWGVQCDELDRAGAEVLGAAQEKWLMDNLSGSRAQWKALAQQIMMMDLDRVPAPDVFAVNPDSWGGYDRPRDRLLRFIRDRRIANTVVLTGDEHQNFAGELYLDGRNPEGTPIAPEFVTTSISSGGSGVDLRPDTVEIQKVSPFLKFHNAQRGYLVCDVTPERWLSEYKVMDQVADKEGAISTRARFAVAAGDPRIVAA